MRHHLAPGFAQVSHAASFRCLRAQTGATGMRYSSAAPDHGRKGKTAPAVRGVAAICRGLSNDSRGTDVFPGSTHIEMEVMDRTAANLDRARRHQRCDTGSVPRAGRPAWLAPSRNG